VIVQVIHGSVGQFLHFLLSLSHLELEEHRFVVLLVVIVGSCSQFLVKTTIRHYQLIRLNN
jgi:hypothetical protein